MTRRATLGARREVRPGNVLDELSAANRDDLKPGPDHKRERRAKRDEKDQGYLHVTRLPTGEPVRAPSFWVLNKKVRLGTIYNPP
jgi:hypothetical protein